jgi:hypothetical protein
MGRAVEHPFRRRQVAERALHWLSVICLGISRAIDRKNRLSRFPATKAIDRKMKWPVLPAGFFVHRPRLRLPARSASLPFFQFLKSSRNAESSVILTHAALNRRFRTCFASYQTCR